MENGELDIMQLIKEGEIAGKIVGDEEVKQEPDNKDASQQKFDLSRFGEYTDEESFYSDWTDKVTKLKSYEEEKGALLSEKQKLENELRIAQEQSSSLIESEDLLRLNIAKNKKDPNFNMYAKLVLNGKESFKDIDVIKTKYINDMPEYAEDQELLDAVIASDYGFKPVPYGVEKGDAEYTEWERSNKIIEMKLKRDAKKIVSDIETNFNSIEIPKRATKPTEEELLISKSSAKNSWTPHVKAVMDDISNVERTVEVGEIKVDFKYGATPELRSKYEEAFNSFIYDNNIEVMNKDKAVMALNTFKQAFVYNNIGDILKSFGSELIKKYDDVFKKELNDDSKTRSTPAVTTGGMAKILSNLGIQ